MHPAWVEVDLGAIADNVRALQATVGNVQMMCVVKADAYGHGLIPVARTAVAAGADWLATAQLSEALAIRAAGIPTPLLCWLHAPGVDFAPALEADIDLGVSTEWALDAVIAAAQSLGVTANVHLKVDTGLGRNGAFSPGEGRTDFAELVDRAAVAQAAGSINVRGIFSHFAAADEPNHPSVAAQHDAFVAAVALADEAGLDIEIRHMANSAAALELPHARWDLVRVGLAMYGLSPTPDLHSSADYGVRPAMRVIARVSNVKRVPAGQGVSYGYSYTCAEDTTLLNVPLGYGDGVPRHASSKADVLVAGQRRQIAGRVCMDQIVIDAGDLEVACGDEVVLFGPGDDGEPTAQDWAAAIDTISYEIVTRFGPHVPRVYLENAISDDRSNED
ncbi:alanine racemase [Ornithinimicrobium sp. Arc0846-15]|nr:alanine racemase [Ornithinimicrobium laminariae]